jgi:hypothetical protein
VHDPSAEYTSRRAVRRAAHEQHDRNDRRIALARLMTAAAAVGIVFGAYTTKLASPWLAAFLVPVFAVLVVLHETVLQRKTRAARQLAHVDRGLARLNDTWRGKGTTGARFADDAHPYAADLDLFSAGSLYELLCLARTRAGEARLASWLKAPADVATIRARQDAVAELAPLLDLREDVDVLADRVAQHGDESALLAWSKSAPALPRWLLPVCAVLVAVTVTLAVLAQREQLPWIAVWIAIAVQGAVTGALWRSIQASLDGVDQAGDDLAVLAGLLARIESAQFSSPLLVALRARMMTDGAPPSRVVARLTKHIHRLHQDKNLFFTPFAFVLMWRPVHAALIARWRAWAGPHLPAWIDGVAELEALLSLSAYAYEHPEDPAPTIVDGPIVEGTALGHPLLANGGVKNDVAVARASERPQLLLVSGSNMSGKSTFMRTVGTNVVLALAGGRVRARSLTVSPLAIGCTLRVQDSLEKGASRFYAEILRLKQVMTLASGGPTLFLVDELLAGTNSRDREAGGAAILRGLVERGAIGLATTHDLALTRVATELGARARNVHFEDVLEGDKVVFDYVLKDGVVERSNALALMRAVGLDV